MFSLIAAAVCLAVTAFAGTPPSYSPSTNGSLGVRYGRHNVREGEILDYSSPSTLPYHTQQRQHLLTPLHSPRQSPPSQLPRPPNCPLRIPRCAH